MTSVMRIPRQTLLAVSLIFAAIAMLLLLRSFAALATNLEAEQAQAAGPTKQSNDPAASNGSYITLNASTPTPPPPTPTPTPPLPGGNWYEVSSTNFETTRLKLTAGSTQIYWPIALKRYDANDFPTANAAGIVGYLDKIANHDYVKAPAGGTVNGALLAHFETNYAYDNTAPSFGTARIEGDCVSSDLKNGRLLNYTITACKEHSALKITNNQVSQQADEDKVFIPGLPANSTFGILNAPNEATGQANLISTWRQSDTMCAGVYGWGAGDAQSSECMVRVLGGNPESVYYKDHIITSYYDKASGKGLGFIYPKVFTTFFGDTFLKGLNPFFPKDNFLSWEYLGKPASPVTRYIFSFTEGRTEFETIGKAIVDGQYF